MPQSPYFLGCSKDGVGCDRCDTYIWPRAQLDGPRFEEVRVNALFRVRMAIGTVGSQAVCAASSSGCRWAKRKSSKGILLGIAEDVPRERAGPGEFWNLQHLLARRQQT